MHPLTRRELVRHAARAGIALTATPLLAACETIVGAGTRLGGGAHASASAGADGYAVPPDTADATGVTVRPDDARISVSRPDVRGPDGAPLMAYLATPRSSGAARGVFVAHGTRGQTEHIRDVVRRLATAGFAALAIDLAAREGGVAGLPEPSAYRSALFQRGTAARVADQQAAVAYLAGATPAVGAIGSGFGGNSVWKMLVARFELKAAVSLYGPVPASYTELWRTATPVFAGYAALDARTTATAASVEGYLKRAGVPYRITVYPDVDRSFDDDSIPDRYDATQAKRAWHATVAWLRMYLAS